MSGPSRADHEKFFSDTFVPITSASGTQYDSCRYEDILAYTSATNGPKCCLPKRFSTWVLTKYLTERWPNERARDALHRINQAISTPNWGPDLLVKLMPDLDTAFFNSRLRTHVQVAWKDESSIVFMDEDTDTLFPNALGLTLFNSVNNSSYIFLNRDNVCHGKPDPRVAMLQTLVHEMVDQLYCRLEPQDSRDSYEDHLSSHGWHFRWILTPIDRRTRKKLGFGAMGD